MKRESERRESFFMQHAETLKREKYERISQAGRAAVVQCEV